MPDRKTTVHHFEVAQFCEDDDQKFIDDGAPGVGARLFGSRVGAGFVNTRHVIELLGINLRDHADSERGRRPVERSVLETAAEVYQVTRQYLIDGTVSSQADALANRLAEIQQRFLADWTAIDGMEDDETARKYLPMIERLRLIREAAGHATPRAASIAHGWPGNLYWEHETGGRSLPPDRFMGYCLSMGARPEYGLLGMGPLEETEAKGWTERRLDRRVDTAPRFG